MPERLRERCCPAYNAEVSSAGTERFRAPIDALAKALGVPVPAAAQAPLLSYVERVDSWNQKLDLTAARTPAALCEVLLADALMLSDPALVSTGSRLIDVGTGAGAPAVPLLVLRQDLSATLVEPKHKRVAFLRGAVGALGDGSRVQVLEARLDAGSAAALVRDPHDVALSRATLAPPDWLALGAELAREVLVLVASEPLPAAPDGMALACVREYRLPDGDRPRKIGLYRRGAD